MTREELPVIGKLRSGTTFRLGDKLESKQTHDAVVMMLKGKVYAKIVESDMRFPIEEFVNSWHGLTIVGNVNIIQESV